MAETAGATLQSGTPQKANASKTILGLAISIVINAVLPFLVYYVLTSYFNATEYLALSASAIPPVIESLVGVVRKRGHLDFFAILALISIAATLILTAIGSDPRLLLIRESFLTAVFGVGLLISLVFPRPAMFYLIRHFATGNSPQNVIWFNSLWQFPSFRRMTRVMTAVWGCGFLVEVIVRFILIFTLNTALFLIVSPFVFYGILGLLGLWSFIYGREGRKRGEQYRQQMIQRGEIQGE